MTNCWHVTYINANNLGPGEYEAIPLPGRITASGSNTVIKDGLKLHITDVKMRSVSNEELNTAGLFVAENGNPSEWLVDSENARDGWHTGTSIVVEGNELVGRELILVAALKGTPPGQDRFIVQLVGYAEI